MPVILHIETSTSVCSVALSKDNRCLKQKTSFEGPSHNVLLSVFIQEMLDYAREAQLPIDAVAISAGPGSYTGLRIGTATAKGLCFGFDIPLIALNTLKIMAKEVGEVQNIEKNTLLCPMIDARRMEVYSAVFNSHLEEIRETKAEIMDENSFSDLLDTHKILFFGNGAEKCKSLFTQTNAIFADNIHPLANNMISLAEEKFEQKEFSDLAYFEPFYLKDFIATTPKKIIHNS